MVLTKVPEWIICLHSPRKETANITIMPLLPSLSALSPGVPKTSEELSCPSSSPSPEGV